MLLTRRAEWRLFLNLETLVQRASVPLHQIPKLVVKELVDNALDAGHHCRFGKTAGGFFVEDNGPGFPGTLDEIADLFSIARPFISSKHVRKPTRGALGNGLRVVTGAVFASGGSIVVRTRGWSLFLRPQEDGRTTIERRERWKKKGSRIEVCLGPSLAEDGDLFSWAKDALALAGRGTGYRGSSSAWWYSADAFWELLNAAGDAFVRDVIGQLAGCSGANASKVAGDFLGRRSASLTRDEAAELLHNARRFSKPVRPQRLGFIGKLAGYPAYARVHGTIQVGTIGKTHAAIPYVLEVWARAADEPEILVCVNRSPITADVNLFRRKGPKATYGIWGCHLNHSFSVPKSLELGFLVNLQCPYVPITTDGKGPDLNYFRGPLLEALGKAAARAKRACRGSGRSTASQKRFMVAALPEAIRRASGDGQYRFSQRQLFYAVRPVLLDAFGLEPAYGWFCKVVTSYENEHGDIIQMYRDTRGTLYHPHTGESIPLGTREVEEYRRPDWTFNKILYCEKEGFFPILHDARWPERHDCALLTSKGFATRAARDVLDLLGESDEELLFFCVHDADGPGTKIFEALQHETEARPGRRVKIINLGLDPAEAMQMGLEVERVTRKGGQAVPVADYVEGRWRLWLQSHRVELNAMTTPQFLEWLDNKIDRYEQGKLVPPKTVLQDRLRNQVRERSRNNTQQRILREQRFEEQAESDFRQLDPAIRKVARGLVRHVGHSLRMSPTDWWPTPIDAVAATLVSTD